MFCVQVDFFALSLALPRMAVDLNETTTNMQWVLSAYMIAVRAAMIPGGRLGDLRGHRRIVVAGLAVFGGASLICGLSFSYGLLIGFRAVQGLGAAALFTVSVAVISNAVASDHRAAAIGALYGIANIGTALGPFIGGLLTEQLSWRWVFFLNVPLAAVAIFCCLRWLPAKPPAGGDGAHRLGGIGAGQLRCRRGGVRGRPRRGMGLELAEVDRFAGPRRCALRRLRRRGAARAGSVDQPSSLPESALRIDHRRRHDREHRLHGDCAVYDDLSAGRARTQPDCCRHGISRAIRGRGAVWSVSWPTRGVATGARAYSATMILGGVRLLVTSAVNAWGAYLPLLGITGFALGLGWTLPSIGTQTVVDPARAGEAAGVNLTVMVTIAGIAVAVAGTLIELGSAGTADIIGATKGVLRLVSVLSLVGGAVLLAITPIGRRSRRSSEVASPAS